MKRPKKITGRSRKSVKTPMQAMDEMPMFQAGRRQRILGHVARRMRRTPYAMSGQKGMKM